MEELENQPEAVATEAPEGETTVAQEAPAPATDEAPAEPQKDFQAIGFEFNAKLADLITQYEDTLPYIYMAKILSNLSIDLLAQQNAIQARYTMEQVVAQAKANAVASAQAEDAAPSRLIRV